MVDGGPVHERTTWDPVVTMLVVAVGLAGLVQPLLPASDGTRMLGFLAPVFFALLLWSAIRRHRDTIGDAKRFWTDLALAFGAWLVGMLLTLFAGDVSTVGQLLIDAIFAAGLVALVRSSERTPFQPQSPRPEAAWPLATVFVFGLFLYFVVLIAIEHPRDYLSTQPLRLLGAATGLYLASRYAARAFAARGGWRLAYVALSAYGLLAASFGILRIAQLAQPLQPFLWLGSIIALAMAARRQPRMVAGLDAVSPVSRLAATGNSAMMAVLVLPILHLTGYGITDVLAPELRDARELLVAAWVFGFGAIAFSERQHFYRTVAHQVSSGEDLRTKSDSDDDLRVILERRRMGASLDQSVAKYARAFELCTDAIGISTMAEGRFIEVNPAFVALTRHDRGSILGRTSRELGLWLHTSDRSALIDTVRRRGGVDGIELPVATADGTRLLRMWAQPIEIDGEACVIIIARPVDPSTRESLPAPFDLASTPAFLVDASGTLRGANAATETRFGAGTPPTTVDALLDMLANRDAPTTWPQLRDRLRREGAVSSADFDALALDSAATRVLLVVRAA